jgi:luciferase family oxidoreductase group 1
MSNYHAASPFRLGLLDCWHHVGNTIALAEEADALGFARYWLTEHPPQPNPQVVAALVAGMTQRIRVGTAGILLHFHAPLSAAQQFLLLEQVYPGRIDAGFCAGSADSLVAEALLDGRPDQRKLPEVFGERAGELIAFLRGNFPAGHRYEELAAWPLATGAPDVWSFGTGRNSAEIAARHGTAFGYSLFHSFSRDDTASVHAYRDSFQPNVHRGEPLVCMAVAGMCAENELEARRLQQAHQNPFLVPTVVGTPRQCHEQFAAIADRYGVNELVFLDLSPTFAARRVSHRLIAEELRLAAYDREAVA